MWSPVGPHVQRNLSNVVTYGTSCTVGPVLCGHLWDLTLTARLGDKFILYKIEMHTSTYMGDSLDNYRDR